MATPCKRCKSTIDVIHEVGHCMKCLSCMDVQKPSTKESDDSAFILNDKDVSNNIGDGIRSFQVVPALASVLKSHQKEGAQFIYRNCFPDCSFCDPAAAHEAEINGCILAHFMGLGKSLTLITLLHTLMTEKSLLSPRETFKKKPLFHMVLLVVPANTLTNWQSEVEKWTGNLDESLIVRNLGGLKKGYQESELRRWRDCGGLLLLSEVHFLSVSDKIIKDYQPDILVLDEAHTTLKKSSNKTFKKLQQIQTKRRICMTGSPLQNNLTEYYNMIEFIKPGVLEVTSVADFEQAYRKPVERGLPSDATLQEKLESLELQTKLKRSLGPYVHRKGADVLHDSLPALQDYLLELEPSKIQQKLMRSHRRLQKNQILSNNFFKAYSDLTPMLNHPGCVKIVKSRRGARILWKDEPDDWLDTLKPTEYDNLQLARNSPKLIVLSHILAMAVQRSEKVLVYSKCLKTLDLVEEFLSSLYWKKRVGSLEENFSDLQLGGWKKNHDYVRIDGGVASGKRGELVETFNETDDIKAFLISSLAGGIGINLCSASIVVILDNHFNPTVSNQCISRAHRYGQDKPVRVFRLAIQNSLESKIYKRSVNKTGVAMRVLDGIYNESSFTSEELNDLQQNDIVLTCDLCCKKRVLPPSQDIPAGTFVCSMNEDKSYHSCAVEEEEKLRQSPVQFDPQNEEDEILTHLKRLINKATSHSRIVKGFAPVETSRDSDICCDEAISMLKNAITGGKEEKHASNPGTRKKTGKRSSSLSLQLAAKRRPTKTNRSDNKASSNLAAKANNEVDLTGLSESEDDMPL